MANPKDMTDEELKNVIETGVEPEEPESNQEAEKEPEVPDEEPEKEPEPEVTPPEEVKQEDELKEESPDEKPPSRRETLRIQQLLAKYGNPDKGTPEPLQPKRADILDYSQALDADPEVIKQLEADRQASNQAQYNEGLKRAEYLSWETSLKIDNPIVTQKYPILDKDSPEFHPAVANALNSWYLKMSGYDANNQTVTNRSIGYKDFVEANMELVEEIAGQKNAQSVKNIAKQTAATGLRPDGSSAKRLNLNQSEKTMNLDELYAAIGQKRPK
jgi:hypothetical protein